MVRAILDGTKTKTRRIMKPQPEKNSHGLWYWSRGGNGGQLHEQHFRDLIPSHCPYGKPGDRLWVRETFTVVGYDEDHDQILGKAGPPDEPWWGIRPKGKPSLFSGKWRPSIHMPRWVSRINLEVVSVRVERLLDISEEDAKAEGVNCTTCANVVDVKDGFPSYRSAFGILWESINGPGSWDANPWVWVVEFKRIESNG